MTLINTEAPSNSILNDAPQTSYEEFLDILAGLRLSSKLVEFDIDRRTLTVAGTNPGLCQKEYDLLAYLAQKADEPVSREELFATVWHGSGLSIDSRTVDAHIRRIRRKLQDVPELISTVRGEGYRFNSAPHVHVNVTRVHTLAA